MKVIVFLIAAFGVSVFPTVNGTPVSQCTTTNASLPEVDVKDCDDPPCIFYTNDVGIMVMKFRAPRYLENIAPSAKALLIPSFPIDYPLDQKNACEGVTNTPCPLAEGEYVEYRFEMSILAIFPEIQVPLEFSLVDNDNNGEAFECFHVDLQIKKKS